MSAVLEHGQVTSFNKLPKLSADEVAAYVAECDWLDSIEEQFPADCPKQTINRALDMALDIPVGTPVTVLTRGPQHNPVLCWEQNGKPVSMPVFPKPVGDDWLDKKPVPQTSDRFRIWDSGDFVQRAPLAWTIQGLLPRAEVAMFMGASGAGKSFLMYDAAAAISRGIDWNGRKTIRGQVLIIAAEGAAGMQNRAAAYAKYHGVPHSDLPKFIADAPDLIDTKDVALLAKRIEGAGPFSTVFVDTLSRTHTANENSGDDMGGYLKHCKFLHEKTGATIVLVHHVGKSDNGARGWSGLKAAMDAEIEVRRKGTSNIRTWQLTKAKDNADGETKSFELTYVPLGVDQFGDEYGSCVVTHHQGVIEVLTGEKPQGKWQEAIIAVLEKADTNGMTAADLQAVMFKKFSARKGRDQRATTLRKALDGLCEKTLIETVGDAAGERIKLIAPEGF